MFFAEEKPGTSRPRRVFAWLPVPVYRGVHRLERLGTAWLQPVYLIRVRAHCHETWHFHFLDEDEAYRYYEDDVRLGRVGRQRDDAGVG